MIASDGVRYELSEIPTAERWHVDEAEAAIPVESSVALRVCLGTASTSYSWGR